MKNNSVAHLVIFPGRRKSRRTAESLLRLMTTLHVAFSCTELHESVKDTFMINPSVSHEFTQPWLIIFATPFNPLRHCLPPAFVLMCLMIGKRTISPKNRGNCRRLRSSAAWHKMYVCSEHKRRLPDFSDTNENLHMWKVSLYRSE